MGYRARFPAYRVGIPRNIGGMRGYRISERWQMREATVVRNAWYLFAVVWDFALDFAVVLLLSVPHSRCPFC